MNIGWMVSVSQACELLWGKLTSTCLNNVVMCDNNVMSHTGALFKQKNNTNGLLVKIILKMN